MRHLSYLARIALITAVATVVLADRAHAAMCALPGEQAALAGLEEKIEIARRLAGIDEDIPEPKGKK